ncbi:MAG: DNA oxidative demethylase AlkB [Reyranella sp.]|nr:DNA oxidative demethylase AlkB [Reyranella sp.]MDP3163260.1 DNA oxidative demethylase AlkB [Reyranella sp.]
MQSLFDPDGGMEALAPGAVLLRGQALAIDAELLAAIDAVVAKAPFRHMVTPGGFEMSVAMTNCGAAGWITDRKSYRYTTDDPESGRPWPAMPPVFRKLADAAAAKAGFPGFVPDACLINRYEPGTRLSPHQDRDEADFGHPIVSVSLGLPATFQFGGPRRADPLKKVALCHGDVVVWGGPARLAHHGVLTLKSGEHPMTGRRRFNLTLRKAL